MYTMGTNPYYGIHSTRGSPGFRVVPWRLLLCPSCTNFYLSFFRTTLHCLQALDSMSCPCSTCDTTAFRMPPRTAGTKGTQCRPVTHDASISPASDTHQGI